MLLQTASDLLSLEANAVSVAIWRASLEDSITKAKPSHWMHLAIAAHMELYDSVAIRNRTIMSMKSFQSIQRFSC